MITPGQANGLKPHEVEWLQSAERLLDRKLLEGYAGEDFRVRLALGPSSRLIGILRQHYLDAGWGVNVYNVTGGHELVFFITQGVPVPAFPVEGTQVAVAEVTETAWDKILLTEE